MVAVGAMLCRHGFRLLKKLSSIVMTLFEDSPGEMRYRVEEVG